MMESVRDRENKWKICWIFLKKGKYMEKVYDVCNRGENKWEKSLSLSNKHKKGSKFQSARFTLIDPLRNRNKPNKWYLSQKTYDQSFSETITKIMQTMT